MNNCNKDNNEVCFNINLTTKDSGNDISWSVGTCKSAGVGFPERCSANGGYLDNQQFVEHCCLEQGNYNISCFDCSGNSWGEGASLEINGIKYCEQFTGNVHEISFSTTCKF